MIGRFLLLVAAVLATQGAERTLVVDFYALGADGTGVADLKQDEVTVRVNGRTRTVRSLRMLRQASLPAADPLAPVVAVPDPFSTNRIAESGRAFVVVVDDESFRPGRERPIRSALRAFLGALTPRDRVSLWTMPHGGIKVDLTTNHDRVQREMELVRGQGPERETGSEGACRTRTTLEATEHLLSSLTGGEGPTTVILFTAGLYGPRRDAPVTRAPGMCELRPDDFQRIGGAAARARAHFYIVQPEDLQRMPPSRADTLAGEGFAPTMNPLEGIEHLAAVTGGQRMSLSRAGDATLIAVARATATYYSAVIDSTSSDQPGAHGLEVKIARAGVEVRSQPFVHVGKPGGGLIPRTLTPPEMVKVGTVFSDLPLRVSGFASQNDPSGSVRLIAAAEPAEPGVTLTAASVAYFDSQGKMVGLTNVKPAAAGVPILTAVVVPPGTYRIRVAAVDNAGRGGAADADVDAEMTSAGPLRLSSLVLGLWRDDAFQPRLQFSAEPVAIAYLDVVGGSAGVAVTAFVEVSRTLTGPAITTTRLTLESTSDPARFTASGAIPIGSLPPGDYVIRAMVGVEGQPFGRVVRTLRKVVQ